MDEATKQYGRSEFIRVALHIVMNDAKLMARVVDNLETIERELQRREREDE